mmetsp:Transcript_57698/g.115584  ORF Transcript_57698/g.115584 Transcript_57698/m.115584 type:complete len:215 (-) Transcript_57698:165-809(-)
MHLAPNSLLRPAHLSALRRPAMVHAAVGRPMPHGSRRHGGARGRQVAVEGQRRTGVVGRDDARHAGATEAHVPLLRTGRRRVASEPLLLFYSLGVVRALLHGRVVHLCVAGDPGAEPTFASLLPILQAAAFASALELPEEVVDFAPLTPEHVERLRARLALHDPGAAERWRREGAGGAFLYPVQRRGRRRASRRAPPSHLAPVDVVRGAAGTDA